MRRMYHAGMAVVANDRLQVALDRLVADLDGSSDDRLESVCCDVTTRDGARELIDRASSRFGPPTVLVNVAGGMKGNIVRDFTSIDDSPVANANVFLCRGQATLGSPWASPSRPRAKTC